MKNKKKNKLIAILAALTLFSGASLASTTYAWWNTLQVAKDETVLLGEGLATIVQATVEAPADKVLVPAGTITDHATQVDEVELKYNVKLSKNVSTPLDLSVVESNVKIGGDVTHAGLVNIVITAPDTLSSTTPKEVVVKVTLTEPADEATYNAIKNQAITFTITFTTALA